MWLCAWLVRCLRRQVWSCVFVVYFFTVTLLLIRIDPAHRAQQYSHDTHPTQQILHFSKLPFKPENRNDFVSERVQHDELLLNSSLHGIHHQSFRRGAQRHVVAIKNPPIVIESDMKQYVSLQKVKDIAKSLPSPDPIPEPPLNINLTDPGSGSFRKIGLGAFAYSAFLDNRKEKTYIRIIALFAKNVSRHFIFCHFKENVVITAKGIQRYEMCENHNRRYGGYIYSCPVLNQYDLSNREEILISLGPYGPRVKIPLIRTRPAEHKLKYLDLRHTSPVPDPVVLHFVNKNGKKVDLKKHTTKKNVEASFPKSTDFLNVPLRFAICVPPLFGGISLFRFVEFMELSRILGAERVFLYDFSISGSLNKALDYYTQKKMATVVPWKLPDDAQKGKDLHYHGQLLAHNDCLYRTMSRFDLVSFNDIDEFLIPHSGAITWAAALPSLMNNRSCGLSFKSAFFHPGPETDRRPWTPVSMQRTTMFSKVRTKVMLCPWRVFEVGIHHISKQNREVWEPQPVPPELAYLHHYRNCVANFKMKCDQWTPDTTIRDKYQSLLQPRYKEAIEAIAAMPERKVENIKKRGNEKTHNDNLSYKKAKIHYKGRRPG